MAVSLDIGLTDDFRELNLSKEIVGAVTDEATLADWYTALGDKHLEVSSFARGYQEAGVEDDDYYRRTGGVLAFCKIAMKWIENRMLSLGQRPPYPPTDPRTREIQRLTEKVKKLSAQAGIQEAA